MQRHSTSDARQSESPIRHSSLVTRHSLLCLAALATFSASAAGIFYAAPDGAGTGTSWADAADLKTAYDAAAQADGGEVWLKGGKHVLTETVVLASNVVVRGGFAGTETSADAADPDANFTLITSDAQGDDMWRPNNTTSSKNYVSIYGEGGGLAEINPGHTHPYWSAGDSSTRYTSYVSDNLSVGFTNRLNSAVSGAAFHGVTFASFTAAAVAVRGGVFENYLFENCRFVACNSMRTDFAPLYFSGTKGVLSNCTFEGCHRAISFVGGTNSLSHCTVRQCYPGSSCSHLRNACVTVSGTAAVVTASDCLFEWNYGENNQSYNSALDMRLAPAASSGGSSRLTHCIFRNGRMTGNVYAPLVHSDGFLLVSHCVFTNNVNSFNGQQAAGAISSGSNTRIDGCYIADNVVTNLHKSSVAAGALIFPGGQYDTQVSDTTIERNVALAASSAPVGTIIVGSRYLHCVFANCLIADNTVARHGSGSGTCAEHYNNQDQCANSHTVFFNTIFSGAGAGGQLFFAARADVKPRLCLVNSAIANYPAQTIDDNLATLELDGAKTNALGQLVVPDGVDPLLRPKAVVGPDGVPARGVSTKSPYAKSARPFWVGGGFWWYPDSASANSTVTKATHYYNHYNRATVAGPNYGNVDFSAPLPADAFGRPRDRSAFALGPLRQEKTTTMMLVK